MGLGDAHQGYSYQDLLSSYYILEDIIRQNVSDFLIDTKQYKEDRFDDFSILHSDAVYSKQIKYSNEHNDHTLTKDDLSRDGGYQLALFSLFQSWEKSLKPKTYLRLCLAWNTPAADLADLMQEVYGEGSFASFPTSVFQFDIDKFWPLGGTPPKGWNKFKSQNLDRQSFATFLPFLTIELELPKFSEDLYHPGSLEKLVLEQIDRLGIGYYPNTHWKKQEFAAALISKVKKHRSANLPISTFDIYSYFNIKTDYGAIQQKFPINETENIETSSIYDSIIEKLRTNQRVVMTGEPGMGKSWLVENIKKHIKNSEIHLIRHLCYTDLSDQHQKQRIQVNTFYANLIKELLEIFPKLKEHKRKYFASDLEELNLLLSEVDEETILVIDGLDHIERIYHFSNMSEEITHLEIEILNAINKLQPSKFVRILAVSQPVAELDSLVGFTKIQIPSWALTEIRSYLAKNGIEDSLGDQLKLSNYLAQKVSGNPLYLRYLVEEIRQLDAIDVNQIDGIPLYNTGLSDYYQYLLSKLNLKEQVPRILSGISFTVNERELAEITGDGDYVAEALSTLLPVIKLNVSQSGYSIYHESFRRFIIEQLQGRNISITQTIHQPIISWFESKDIFTHQKSYRYYFQFVYEVGKTTKILPFATTDFIWTSVFYGHHWNVIKNNLRYITKSVLSLGNMPQVFLIAELNRVISGTEDAFNESLISYLTAIGHLEGFQSVADYLVYEGDPTLGLESGLKACKLCNEHKVPAPWQTYLDFYAGGEVEITDEMFGLILEHYIESENEQKIIKTAEHLIKETKNTYRDAFRQVFEGFQDSRFVQEVIQSNSTVASLLQISTQTGSSAFQLSNLLQQLLDIDHLRDRDIDVLELFVKMMVSATEPEYKKQTEKLRMINWFYNWVIFATGIGRLQQADQPNQQKLLELFQLLTYDTEPFKGKPCTSDLYQIEDFILYSIKQGIRLVSEHSLWSKIVDALVKVSDETTVSIQRSLGGPLPTDKLFKLLMEFRNEVNWQYIAASLENVLIEKSEYHLHSYIAEYHFNLAVIYAAKDRAKVIEHLKNGVQFTIGYTFRRDMTIEDLLDSVESLHLIDKNEGLKRIKDILPMVNAVVNHTDGKSTKHFPVEWFTKFLKVDVDSSEVYLLNNLSDVRIDWRLEDNFENLLLNYNADMDVMIEMYLSRTMPLLSSHAFLNYSLHLLKKLASENIEIAKQYLGTVFEKFRVAFRNKISEVQAYKLLELIKVLDEGGEIDTSLINFDKSVRRNNVQVKDFSKKYLYRKDMGLMSTDELGDYIRNNSVKSDDLQSLTYAFSLLSESPSIYEPLIDSFFTDAHRYNRPTSLLNKVFEDGSTMELYFQLKRFMHDTDGYYRSLVNSEAFVNAYRINDGEAVKTLRTKLGERFDEGFSRSLSGNLFNALAHVNYDTSVLVQCWDTMFESIKLRLPVSEPIEWDDLLSLPFAMNRTERGLCFLITRFKAGTTERYQWSLAGIVAVLHERPALLIKPFRWFFSKWKNFESSIQLTIVQIIYDYAKEDAEYGQNFKSELAEFYPTRYFLIDAMIENMLNLPRRKLVKLSGRLIFPRMSDGEIEFFMERNSRHRCLEASFIDIVHAFQKTKASYKTDVIDKEKLEIYGNRMYKMVMNNIIFSSYILNAINTELYEELYEDYDRMELIESSKLNIMGIIANMQSIGARNYRLRRPSQFDEKVSRHTPETFDGWVRMAHYEKELFEQKHFNLEEMMVYGAVQFTTDEKVDFPFSNHRFPVEAIFKNKTPFNEGQLHKVFFNYESDGLEDYFLIWLHSNVINYLGLNIQPYYKGLYAIDKDGLCGLQYRSWKSEYLGLGASDHLQDEIPKLVGGELLIREDLYQRLVSWIGVEAQYFIRKS